MNRFGLFSVVALFGIGCGSVQDETKKAPPAKEECKDAPGKLVLVLVNDAGTSVCSGSAELDLDNNVKGSKAVEKLGEVEGAEACGFEFTAGGTATLSAPGFGETKASWQAPGKCEVKVLKVTLKK